MTDIEQAIEWLEEQMPPLEDYGEMIGAPPQYCGIKYVYNDPCGYAFETAIQALQEKAERDKGCEYCNGKRNEYQHTIDTKLSINTFEKARVLETECNRCPPYANCCMKNIPSRSVFLINFCPNCGRKLTSAPADEH